MRCLLSETKVGAGPAQPSHHLFKPVEHLFRQADYLFKKVDYLFRETNQERIKRSFSSD